MYRYANRAIPGWFALGSKTLPLTAYNRAQSRRYTRVSRAARRCECRAEKCDLRGPGPRPDMGRLHWYAVRN